MTSEAIDRDSSRRMEILEEFAEAQGKMVIKPGALGYIPGDVLRQPHDSHLRAWRERQRAAGLCMRCSQPAARRRVLCQRHLDYNCASNSRSFAARQAYRLERGLCTLCGEVSADGGYRRCTPCRQRAARENYQRYSPYADRRSA